MTQLEHLLFILHKRIESREESPAQLAEACGEVLGVSQYYIPEVINGLYQTQNNIEPGAELNMTWSRKYNHLLLGV